MIGQPYRIVLNSLRIIGHEVEVRDFLISRYPRASVLLWEGLGDSRVVVEVQTSNREESGSPGTADEVEIALRAGISSDFTGDES
jgi:hypothetical protein